MSEQKISKYLKILVNTKIAVVFTMEANETNKSGKSPKPRKPEVRILSEDFKPVSSKKDGTHLDTVIRWRELSKKRGAAKSNSGSRPSTSHTINSENYSKFVHNSKNKKQQWERTFALKAMHKFRERVSSYLILRFVISIAPQTKTCRKM